MLIEFKTENYRSFGEERKLSMVAGKSRVHPEHVMNSHGLEVLTFSAVFGANASGKSNLVRAMRESRDKIVRDESIPRNSWNRMDDSNIGRTTGFEYVFSTDACVYTYGFELFVESGVIHSEWLYDITDGDVRLFERDVGRIDTDLDDADYPSILGVLEGLIGSGSHDLLLKTLSKMGSSGRLFEAAREAMSWFSSSLIIAMAGDSVLGAYEFDRDGIVRKVLTSYDTGITDTGYEEVEYPPAGMPQLLREHLENDAMRGLVAMVYGPEDMLRYRYDGGYKVERAVFEHDGKKFGFKEESDGTQRLYDLLPILDPSVRRNTTFVIDELDRSLHPLMVCRLVEDFLRLAKGCERQLIITTHETKLQDMRLVRRDEIWYTQRDLKGNTELYSMEEFKERVDRRVERAYLDGRYGAIPRFDRYMPKSEADASVREDRS